MHGDMRENGLGGDTVGNSSINFIVVRIKLYLKKVYTTI